MGIKKYLRPLFPNRLWTIASVAKNSVLKLFEKLFLSIFRIFPEPFRLDIKSRLQMIKAMDYEGRKIYLSVDSKVEYYTRLRSARKEPGTVKWIETFFKEGDVVYDIGANVGAYSLVAAKLFKNINVYAFEPSFVTFPKLCKNIVINHVQETVFPLQIALSDKTSVDIFSYASLATGDSSNVLGDIAVDPKGGPRCPIFRQKVLSYRIDDLISSFHLPSPNHLKIDVDGAELKVLRGGEAALRHPNFRSLVLELSEGGEKEIMCYLSQLGLTMRSKYVLEEPGMYNCVMVRGGEI